MSSANEVKVSYIADIRDLTEKLKSVTGITASEARAQVTAVVAAQKAMAASTSKTGSATDAAGLAASKAAKAFGPLGGILAKLDPTAGALSSTVAAGTSALEGFGVTAAASGVAIGGLAVALGAGYLAYSAYNAESDRAAATAALVATAHEKMTPLIDATRVAQVKAAVATGQMSEEAGRLELAGVAAMKAYGAATADTETKIKALHAEQQSLTQQVKDAAVQWTGDAAEMYAGWNPIATAAAYYTRNLLDTTADLDAQVNALMATEGEAAEVTKAGVAATNAATAATARRAAASADLAKAEEVAAASRAGAKNRDAIMIKQAEDEHKAEKAYADMVLKDYEDEASASKALSDQLIDDARRVAAEQEQARTRRIQDEIATASALANLGDQLVSATTRQYDTTTAAGRDAARRQFATQKAANLAIGAINTAVAVSTALKDYPVPPLSIVMGGIALASGLIAEGAIAASPAPSFHSGYAPDEMQARVLRNESVMTPTATAALGKRRMDLMNDGVSQGNSTMPAPVIIDHRIMNTLIKRELSTGGALAAALASDGVVGHRKNRRGVTG